MSFDNKIGEGKYVISVDSSGAISQLQKFEQQAQKTGQTTSTSFKQGLASAVSLTAGITSLAFQFDNLDRAQLRVRKTSLEMSRAQEEVNKLAEQGKQGTLDYQQALERLAIATEKNRQAQNDATQSQIAFGLSMAQTALTIPSAIQGIKGLTSVTAILNTSMSKWVLIALAAIAAYEGIAQAVKHFTGQDYTITSAVGNMINNISGLTDTVKDGTDSMVGYSSSVGMVGVTAQATASSLGQVNQQIEQTNSKLARGIDTLKKNEDEIKKSTRALLIQYGASTSANFLPTRNILGGDSIFQIEQAMRNYKNNVYGGSVQTPAHILEAASEMDRLENERRRMQKNPHELNTSGARVSRTVSDLLSNIPRQLIGSLGTSRSVILNNAQALSASFARTQDELAEFGLSLPSMGTGVRGGKGHVETMVSDDVYRQRFADVMSELGRRKQARVDAENNRIMSLVSRSGFTRSEVVALESTQQGTDDLYGIIDYRERLARASTGTG